MRSQKPGVFWAGMCLWLWAAAAATEYQIDPAHSQVLFKARHMGINTVTGRFDSLSGSFDVDPKNIAATKGSAVIQTASVNTDNARRDHHLRSDDFFNAEKYPQIKFVSKAVRNINVADSTCDLIGDLTIRDVTKEIVLKVKGGGVINDGHNERAAFTATGSLNRFDYGLKWNKLLEAGGFVVGPTIQLELAFEGVHPLASSSAPDPQPGKPARDK